MQHSSWMNQRSIVTALVCAGCAIGGAGCGPLEEEEGEDLSVAEATGVAAESLPYQNATWMNLPQMSTGRAGHGAALLPNGKVLVVGGEHPLPSEPTAEILDPVTQTWSQPSPANYHHTEATATLLADGRVLVAGGGGPPGFLSTEIYDPASDTWTSVPVADVPRGHHSAVRLSDGRVLLAGGYLSGDSLSSAHLFDPVTGSWSPTGLMNHARSGFSLTLLQDGRVLAAGGKVGGGNIKSAEIFDPQAGTWTLTSSMYAPRSFHAGVLLQNGKVLVAGSDSHPHSVEVFDPVTHTWSSAAPLPMSRNTATGVMLGNGKVLLAGGVGDGGSVVTQLYDPAADQWTLLDAMNTMHLRHTMTPLPCGQVVVTGGASGFMKYRSVEILPAVDDTICARAGGSTAQ